ncbi:hypothetical protein [Chloroflexus sp.]|uniref:hypothetical protein n=1 Tax=Chloroflexus sp. TaxID=1904827 RepID=UPI002ACEB99B|nr:hypothetical protein [Chloroflexus sp.]
MMNDPLANLLARSVGDGLAGTVQPRLPARFEPVALPADDLPLLPVEDDLASAPPPLPPRPAEPLSARAPEPAKRRELLPLPAEPPPAWGQPPTIGGEMGGIPTRYPAQAQQSDAPARIPPAWGQPPTIGSEMGAIPMRYPVQVQQLDAPDRILPDVVANEANNERITQADLSHVLEPASAVDQPRRPSVALDAPPPRAVPAIAREPVAPTRPPRITVTIGRVEVRAMPPSPPLPSPPPRPRSQPPAPKLSLDEYLRRREGGKR